MGVYCEPERFWILGLIGTVLFILVVFGVRIWYEKVVLLNVFLMPVGIFEPSPSDILFAFLLLFMFTCRGIDYKRIMNQKLFLMFSYIYLIINLISLFHVDDIGKSLRFCSITVYLVVYALFILVYSSENNYPGLARAYIAGSTLSAVLGIIGYIGFFPGLLSYDVYRTKALFKDPNVFGPFLVPTIIFLIHSLTERNYVLNSIPFHLGLILVNTLGVILSFSRGAWLNLLAVLSIYTLLNVKRLKLARIMVFLLIGILLVYVVWSFFLSYEFKSYLIHRCQLQSYDTQRFSVQREGVVLGFKSISGYGPGQYEEVMHQIIWTERSAHSLYIRVLLENGIIGLILLLTPMLFVLYKLLLKHIKRERSPTLDCSLLFSIIAGIMLSSVAVDTLHWRHLWFFIGLGLSVTQTGLEA